MCENQVEIKKVEKKVEPVKKMVKPKVKLGPLVYKWSEAEAFTNDQWGPIYQKLLQAKATGKKLQIVGPYYSDEKNNTTFANLGLARAEEVKKMFIDKVDPKLILTSGKLIRTGAMDAKKTPFDGVKYLSWIVSNKNVKEINGKTLIYFPSNSSKEITNKDILNYLNDLTEQLKDNKNWDIQITGHTDTDGDEKSNYNLGLKRAKKIRTKLISKGIDGDRIRATSKGEIQPIAPNNTNAGKQKNRRVEIQIMK